MNDTVSSKKNNRVATNCCLSSTSLGTDIGFAKQLKLRRRSSKERRTSSKIKGRKTKLIVVLQ